MIVIAVILEFYKKSWSSPQIDQDCGTPDNLSFILLFPLVLSHPFGGLSTQLARRMISIIRFKAYVIEEKGTPMLTFGNLH